MAEWIDPDQKSENGFGGSCDGSVRLYTYNFILAIE